MSFSDEDFAKQAEQFQALQEELSRLDSVLESHKKAFGVTSQDLKAIDINNIPAELLPKWSQAQEQAKRAGEARVAQMQSLSDSSKKSGTSRRAGAIKL